jgi:hypothetical protein
MGARVVVGAVCVLALAAAADALRGLPPERGRGADVRAAGVRDVRPVPRLAEARAARFAGDGAFLTKRVLRDGREFLSAEDVERAFPGERDGPIDISKIAVAPDGTLALGVYRFRTGAPAAGAIELWRGRRLAGAFAVPPGWFGGGIAFDPTGTLVATFSRDGQLRGVFDRRGRRLDDLDEFLQLD